MNPNQRWRNYLNQQSNIQPNQQQKPFYKSGWFWVVVFRRQIIGLIIFIALVFIMLNFDTIMNSSDIKTKKDAPITNTSND